MPKTTQKTRKKSPSRGGFRNNSGRKAVGKLRGFRASDDQWKRWKTAAKTEGVTISEWLRDAADKIASGNYSPID